MISLEAVDGWSPELVRRMGQVWITNVEQVVALGATSDGLVSLRPYGAGYGTIPYQYITDDAWEAFTAAVPGVGDVTDVEGGKIEASSLDRGHRGRSKCQDHNR